MDTTELVKVFGAFFAIMNPFVNLPIFLALTSSMKVTEQRALAVKIVILSAIMCGIILLFGRQIIGFFGITIDQFRIAGGIVLAHIAWSMLQGDSVTSHHGNAKEQGQMQDLTSLAFYPITFPIIVGPGTIATLIIYSGQADTMPETLAIAAIVAAILIILFFVLFFASAFGEILTDTMRVITTRLMGMILLAIAIEMIFDGAKAVLPGLA